MTVTIEQAKMNKRKQMMEVQLKMKKFGIENFLSELKLFVHWKVTRELRKRNVDDAIGVILTQLESRKSTIPARLQTTLIKNVSMFQFRFCIIDRHTTMLIFNLNMGKMLSIEMLFFLLFV
jgi:hypothetical protein